MAYNIFIDNAISYGYINGDAFRNDSIEESRDLTQATLHSNHDGETSALVGQNQTHIIAGALRNLSANYKNTSGKYGAMYIKIGQGNFNLSDIANDDTWRTFVDEMNSTDEGTNLTRIYKKSDSGYTKVSRIDELTDDDNLKTDDTRFENHEYILVYGYDFIRENGRKSIKVPMMPNIYSVFADGNVHVFVNDGTDGWKTQPKDISSISIFENGNVTTPTDFYGEFKSQVNLDGWITKTLRVGDSILTRKWSTSEEYATAQTYNVAGPYSIRGKDNIDEPNELYIWFDKASGNIYLGTLTNATFDGAIPSDDGEYITADGGQASVIVKPKTYYTFDVNTLSADITFETENVGDTPTIESVTRDDDNGNVTITLNGVIDDTLGDGKPKIIVPEPRQTKLNISAVYHKFDPFVGRGDGHQQQISNLTATDLIFRTGGYNVTELESLNVAPSENLTVTVDGVEHEYVYFGLSKGENAVDDGSKIVDTAIFNVADDENKALIEVDDNSVVYHLYYVDTLDLNAEVTLTNVHEYKGQAGPDESGKYLNDGRVEDIQ